jgi:S1-C subfamily serine protease
MALEAGARRSKHGFLGVAFSNERSRSLYVAEVMRGGAADATALAAGDRVIAFNAQPVAEIAELQRLLSATKPGEVVKLDVMRGEQTITLDVRLTSAHEIAAGLEGSQPTAP